MYFDYTDDEQQYTYQHKICKSRLYGTSGVIFSRCVSVPLQWSIAWLDVLSHRHGDALLSCERGILPQSLPLSLTGGASQSIVSANSVGLCYNLPTHARGHGRR